MRCTVSPLPSLYCKRQFAIIREKTTISPGLLRKISPFLQNSALIPLFDPETPGLLQRSCACTCGGDCRDLPSRKNCHIFRCQCRFPGLKPRFGQASRKNRPIFWRQRQDHIRYLSPYGVRGSFKIPLCAPVRPSVAILGPQCRHLPSFKQKIQHNPCNFKNHWINLLPLTEIETL